VSTSVRIIWPALAAAEKLGISRPLKGPSLNVNGRSSEPPEVFPGKRCSRILVMAARWVPASTASREPLLHAAAVERTRKAVVLSSLGPPPQPYTPRY
jgi:hypothetical protein